MPFQVWYNPYAGLAESIVTSNVIDLRDAAAWTLSAYTSSGTSSVLSVDLSNATGGFPGAMDTAGIPEASWSHHTLFGLTSGASFMTPPNARWARVRRTVSNASYVINVVKTVQPWT